MNINPYPLRIILYYWKDNSMGNNILRFKADIEGLSFRDARRISNETIILIDKLTSQLEIDLKNSNDFK